MASLSRLIAPPASVSPAALPNPCPVRKHRLELAEWHLREAVAMAAIGDFENEDCHLEFAQEWLGLAVGCRVKARDADALRFELQKELEA